MFSVDSAFLNQANNQNPDTINLGFWFSGSKEPFRVLDAANVVRSAKKFTAGTFNINVANVETNSPNNRPGFNILHIDKTHFNRPGTFGISFVDSAGVATQSLQLFQGNLVRAKYTKAKVNLSFLDNFDYLKNLTIGTDENKVQFINSDWNPADLLWTVVTSWGRLDTTSPSGNTDIDHTTFDQYKSDMDDLSIKIGAEFSGQNMVDVIQKIADISNSVIVGEGDGKIYCYSNKPTFASSKVTFTDSQIFDMSLTMDTKDIINFGAVYYGYDPNLSTWVGSYINEHTSSINTYSRREQIFDDTTIWHTNLAAAQGFLDNKIALFNKPVEKFNITLGYTGLRHQLNDKIGLIDNVLSLNGTIDYNIQKINMDIDKGRVKFDLLESLGSNWFFLDTTTFGVLDQNYNPIY